MRSGMYIDLKAIQAFNESTNIEILKGCARGYLPYYKDNELRLDYFYHNDNKKEITTRIIFSYYFINILSNY
jgi:hypothetical protein